MIYEYISIEIISWKNGSFELYTNIRVSIFFYQNTTRNCHTNFTKFCEMIYANNYYIIIYLDQYQLDLSNLTNLSCTQISALVFCYQSKLVIVNQSLWNFAKGFILIITTGIIFVNQFWWKLKTSNFYIHSTI